MRYSDMLEDDKNSALYKYRKRIFVEDEHDTFRQHMKEQPCHMNQLTGHDKLEETRGTTIDKDGIRGEPIQDENVLLKKQIKKYLPKISHDQE